MRTPRFYTGRGVQSQSVALPAVNRERMRAPEGYRASAGLAAAVDVALRLGMPLLLTGEPGSGKSQLASSVAWELGLGKPLRFVVKSDTTGPELFYQFDTVARFHAAHSQGDIDARSFIRFNALGKAILYTHPLAELRQTLGSALDALEHPGEPRRSIVLIDEIDKAPRDVPNDLLTEMEDMAFQVNELGQTRFAIHSDARYLNPIVIITSNSEKSLPDAFLRRCIYYHVPFPKYDSESPDDVTVQSIVVNRLGDRFGPHTQGMVLDAIAFLRLLRDQPGLERRPGLAELLNWLDYLTPQQPGDGAPRRLFDMSDDELAVGIGATLLKLKADQVQMERILKLWRNEGSPP